jgi:hypothetical protein
MNINLDRRRVLQSWLTASLNDVNPLNPVHKHADELVPEVARNSSAMLEAITPYFRETIALLSAVAADVMPVLTIPLKEASSLIARPPDLSNLSSELSDEPPSIYLVHREASKVLVLSESYRCFLAGFQPAREPLPNVWFFYETSRGERERAHGWEYRRAIFGRHYPPNLTGGYYSVSE